MITSDNSISIIENTPAGETILQVQAVDPENDDVTFALTGDDASAFALSDSGQLSFVAAPDYETKSAYALGIRRQMPMALQMFPIWLCLS